jgi:hypothetical protein
VHQVGQVIQCVPTLKPLCLFEIASARYSKSWRFVQMVSKRLIDYYAYVHYSQGILAEGSVSDGHEAGVSCVRCLPESSRD